MNHFFSAEEGSEETEDGMGKLGGVLRTHKAGSDGEELPIVASLVVLDARGF